MIESDSPMLPAPQQRPLAFSRTVSTSSNLQTTSTNDSSKCGSTSSQRFVGFIFLSSWGSYAEELRRFSNEMASLGNLNEDERNYELPQYSLKAVQGEQLSGRIVAVQRLSERFGQGLKEFMSGVILIQKLRHKNLVHLWRREKILIYEFMPNVSLDAFLYGDEPLFSLFSSYLQIFI
ncbi:hypothetical protein EJ110_NYTH29259 [Nymphaea thermarum]|nr:hypothetical protein EJ110_NYTH29259 [Nymphaea thermarum]